MGVAGIPRWLPMCMRKKLSRPARQTLRCLDMRVLDGDLIMPTCLRMPTLILPPRHFIQMYYDLDIQGCYASQFPSGGQDFLQPRGDIRASIVPRDFRALPVDVQRGCRHAYFHREELEDWAEKDPNEDQHMSTDTEAVAGTVRWLQVGDQTASASLQEAVCDMLTPATAPQPQEQECYYDSDDSVLNLDEEFTWHCGVGGGVADGLKGCCLCTGMLATLFWRDRANPVIIGSQTWGKCWIVLGKPGQWPTSRYNQWLQCCLLPSEVPMLAIVRDLDCQCQQRFDQMVAKWRSYLLDSEQCKWANTPPQSDHEDAPMRECTADQIGAGTVNAWSVKDQKQRQKATGTGPGVLQEQEML